MGRVAGLTPDETRRRVVEGAALVFARLGFERARVSDIAEAAGVSSGAMYNHFESKADLLVAVIESRAGEQLASLLSAGDAEGPLDAILARGRALASRDRAGAPLLVEAAIAARHDPDVLRVLTEQVGGHEDTLAAFIGLGQARGKIAGDIDARTAARFLHMVLFGSLVVQGLDLPVLDPDAWGSLLARLVDGLRPEATP